MKKILFLFTFYFICIAAWAVDWKKYADNLYIDTSSIIKNKNGSYDFVFKKINYANNLYKRYEKKYKKKISYGISKASINCKDKTILPKSISLFDYDNKIIHSKDYDSKNIGEYYILPNSEEEILYKNICSSYLKQTDNNIVKIGEDINSVDFNPYMKRLQNKIYDNWNPIKFKSSKKTVLYFSILKNGKLKGNIKVMKSSGNKVMDEIAVQTIKDSAPFESLPKEFDKKYVDIEFTFSYKVNDD